MRLTKPFWALLACVAMLGTAGMASSQVLPPNAKAYGKTLSEWLNSFWRWYYSPVGNLGVFQPTNKPIVFLPLPQGSEEAPPAGSGYLLFVGHRDVTIPSGTAFVMPTFAWTMETYDPILGYPDDPAVPYDALLQGVTQVGGGGPPLILLDGKRILRDYWSYYIPPMAFSPPIMYETPTWYGAIGAIAFQGTGFIVPPLSVGTHTLSITEELTFFGSDIVFDNSWTIHVVPPGVK